MLEVAIFFTAFALGLVCGMAIKVELGQVIKHGK